MAREYEKYSINDVTGACLVTKPATQAYMENYDVVFKHSVFENSKRFKKQFPSMYEEGWRVDSLKGVINDLLVEVWIKNKEGETLFVSLKVC